MRSEGIPDAALYRAAAAGLVVGATLTLLSSLLWPETTDSSVPGFIAGRLHYPTAIVGVILLVVCLPSVFLRVRKRRGATLALCGTSLVLVAWLGLSFGLGFAAGIGLTSRVGFITLLALPWSVMLPLPQLVLESGPALPNLFFIISALVVGLGGVLLGTALLRAGALGRAAGLALIVCTVPSVITGFLPLPGTLSGSGEALYMVGFLWSGVALWRISGPALPDVSARPQEVAPVG